MLRGGAGGRLERGERVRGQAGGWQVMLHNMATTQLSWRSTLHGGIMVLRTHAAGLCCAAVCCTARTLCLPARGPHLRRYRASTIMCRISCGMSRSTVM
jgi:hypothetical protein